MDSAEHRSVSPLLITHRSDAPAVDCNGSTTTTNSSRRVHCGDVLHATLTNDGGGTTMDMYGARQRKHSHLALATARGGQDPLSSEWVRADLHPGGRP